MSAPDSGVVSSLFSPLIINNYEGCMTFWYHMNGRNIGSLQLNQLYSEGRDAIIRLWGISGNFSINGNNQ